VDEDTIDRVCHGKWSFDVDKAAASELMPSGAYVNRRSLCHLTDGKATVLAESDGAPVFTKYSFGKGTGYYLSSFEKGAENNRMLLNILIASGRSGSKLYITDNCFTECAYYPESGTLVVINNSSKEQKTSVGTEKGVKEFVLKPYDAQIVKI
jgi:beta-D-galactosyl-(1->4)-L-rhamnose phosphorylase